MAYVLNLYRIRGDCNYTNQLENKYLAQESCSSELVLGICILLQLSWIRVPETSGVFLNLTLKLILDIVWREPLKNI